MFGIENDKDEYIELARMDPDQIKGARLSSIMTLDKGAGLLNNHF